MYKSVRPSGRTTKNTDPPKALQRSRISKFESLADRLLPHDRIAKYLGHKEIYSLILETLQDSESDVITTSFAYMLQPITEVLYIMFPNQWKAGYEMTTRLELDILDPRDIKKDNRMKKRNVEYQEEDGIEDESDYSTEDEDEYNTDDDDGDEDAQKQKNGKVKGKLTTKVLRFDYAIRKPSQSDHKGDVIAIVEYKRRELIRYKDFRNALLPETATPKDIEQLKGNHVKNNLKGNGISYGKQVAAYALRSFSKHVALCNYDNLLLFDFFMLKFENGERKLGNEAKFSWVREGTDGNDLRETGLLRKVLLGWILQAFSDAGIQSEFVD